MPKRKDNSGKKVKHHLCKEIKTSITESLNDGYHPLMPKPNA